MKKVILLLAITLGMNASAQMSARDSVTFLKGYNSVKGSHSVFDEQTRYTSPMFMNAFSSMSVPRLIKVVGDDGSVVTYLSLDANSVSLAIGEGLKVLLDDGSKMEFPDAAADADVNSNGGYRYSCFVRLTDDQVETLANHRIKAWECYIFGNAMFPARQLKIMGVARKMTEIK
jgi:hypothetical protein